MRTIKINLILSNDSEISHALLEINRLINQGYVSSVNPYFEITGEEELEEDEYMDDMIEEEFDDEDNENV